MRFVRPFALVGAVSLGLLMACQAAEEDTEEGSGAIQGGSSDTEHKFAVGIKLASGGVCSGVLIAPNLVMTAQHCVSGAEGSKKAVDCKNDTFLERPVDAPDVIVTTDTKLPGKKQYKVSNVVVPESREMCNADIALLVLTSNISDREATPATPKLADMSKTGKIAAIGYGRSASAKEDSGERRIKKGISIKCVPTDTKKCDGTGDREYITAGGVCEGDSGSGSFLLDDDKATVTGILARTERADGKCSGGIYTRTDKYAALIVAAAVEAARKGSYDVPAWARPKGTSDDDVPSFGSETTPPSGRENPPAGENPPSTGNDDDKGGGLFGGLFDNVDWGKVLDFVKKVVPSIGGDKSDGKPRESKPPVQADAGVDAGAAQPTKPADYVPPGGDRQAPASTSSSSDSDSDSDDSADEPEDETAPKKKKADSGCSAGALSPSSSTSTGLLFGALALAAVAGRRRRASK